MQLPQKPIGQVLRCVSIVGERVRPKQFPYAMFRTLLDGHVGVWFRCYYESLERMELV